MTTRRRLILLACVALGAATIAGGVMLLDGGSSPESSAVTAPAVPGAAAPSTAIDGAPKPFTAAPRQPASGPARPPVPVERAPIELVAMQRSPSGEGVQLGPQQVVASVGGVALRGSDLMAFDADGSAAITVSRASFDALRARAIDREVVRQAAASAGIALGATHERRLERLKTSLGYGPDVIAPKAMAPERVAHTLRDAEALMLQTALLEDAGIAPPYVTAADVAAHYEAHAANPEDAVGAAQELQIRGELTRSRQNDYDQRKTAYMASLRSGVAIEVAGIAPE